jgi:hypothetical protein
MTNRIETQALQGALSHIAMIMPSNQDVPQPFLGGQRVGPQKMGDFANLSCGILPCPDVHA